MFRIMKIKTGEYITNEYFECGGIHWCRCEGMAAKFKTRLEALVVIMKFGYGFDAIIENC